MVYLYLIRVYVWMIILMSFSFWILLLIYVGILKMNVDGAEKDSSQVRKNIHKLWKLWLIKIDGNASG